MFQGFEALKVSQNTLFTPFFKASKLSKSRKIRDSRRVSRLRSSQSLAKYVIHAVFQGFEALKVSQKWKGFFLDLFLFFSRKLARVVALICWFGYVDITHLESHVGLVT